MDAAQGRAVARRTGRDQEQVVDRRQLRAAGVPRWVVALELRTGRWTRYGRQVVVLHNGPRSAAALRWAAVLSLGPRAAVDGVTALQHLGVGVLTDGVVHVLVPKGTRVVRLPGVHVHESRRYRQGDVVTAGLPHVRPEVAAVHAALWARSDREAAYVLALTVQQRLATAAQLAEAVETVRRHVRRRLLLRTVAELAIGVRSLGELDVARAMRSRGLPEPQRQVLRRRGSGREYLDADFPLYGITMEVDGWQHDDPAHRVQDVLRDLQSAEQGRTVVRLPLVAWRLDEAAVLDGLERLFASRGWQRPAA